MIENAQLMHLLSEFVGDAGILSGRVKCGVAPGNTGQVYLAAGSVPERRLYATKDACYL